MATSFGLASSDEEETKSTEAKSLLKYSLSYDDTDGNNDDHNREPPTAHTGHGDIKPALTWVQTGIIIINTISIRACLNIFSIYEYYIMEALNFSLTDMSYIIIACSIGGVLSFMFPTMVAKINSKYQNISYSIVLTLTHGLVGILFITYAIPVNQISDNVIYYIITRFITGILIKIFSVYKNLLIINYAKSSNSWMLNYSIIYISYPTSRLILVIPFGFILYFVNYYYACLFLGVPLIVTSFLLIILLPKNNISYMIRHSAKAKQNNVKNETTITLNEYVKVLANVNRALKMIIGLLGAIKISAFTVCLSLWFENSYDINSYQFYIVLLMQIIGQVLALVLSIYVAYFVRISHIDKKHDSTAIFLYTLSKILSVICFLIMFILGANMNISLALLITLTMYFASMLRSTTGGTLNMQLIDDISHKRAQFSSYKLSFMALGTCIGVYTANLIYDKYGITYIGLYGLCISSVATCCCLLLWHRMKKQNIIS